MQRPNRLHGSNNAAIPPYTAINPDRESFMDLPDASLTSPNATQEADIGSGERSPG